MTPLMLMITYSANGCQEHSAKTELPRGFDEERARLEVTTFGLETRAVSPPVTVDE